MPNESTQTMEIRYKRCPYCGGDAKESECGQVDEPKQRSKPENKMVERQDDK